MVRRGFHGRDKVTDLAGQRVVLTGSEDNGTVEVKNVKTVPKPGSNWP
jgi:hypothetical protein